MRLKPGKLYKVNLRRRSAYERRYGISISATFSWRLKPEDRINLKSGDILLFVKKGEPQGCRHWDRMAYTPYTFIYDDKIIEFQKRYDTTLKSIFEEMES